MLQYQLIDEEERLNVLLEGDLDIEATELIQEKIKPMLNDYSSVNINLAQVPFVDSSGIGLLIDLVRTAEEIGSVVTIAEVRDEVFEVFELLQIPEIIGTSAFV